MQKMKPEENFTPYSVFSCMLCIQYCSFVVIEVTTGCNDIHSVQTVKTKEEKEVLENFATTVSSVWSASPWCVVWSASPYYGP